MNQELKNLQQKYAINLFDWYDFKSKSTGKESDSLVLVIGDVDGTVKPEEFIDMIVDALND